VLAVVQLLHADELHVRLLLAQALEEGLGQDEVVLAAAAGWGRRRFSDDAAGK